MNTFPNFSNYNRFTEIGRLVGIRFKNEKDAIKILLEKIKLNLPCTPGRKALIVPGELLKKYLEEFK
jgi:hypothetical protein